MGKDRKRQWNFKTIVSIIGKNGSVLLIFEILYRVFGLAFFFPFLGRLIAQLPGFINESYLSQENFSRLFFSPGAILIMVSVIVLLGGYLYIEIVALLLYSQAGWRREQITLWQMVRRSVENILGMFRVKRLAVFLLLPVMPITFFGAVSIFMRGVKIPEFIVTAIMGNALYRFVWLIAMVVVNGLMFFYLFGFPSLLLTDGSFGDSWKESFRLLKGKIVQTILRLVFCTLVFAAVLYAVYLTALGLLAGTNRLFYGADAGRENFRLCYHTFSGVWNLLSGALISVFFCTVILVLYHMYRQEGRPEKTHRKCTAGHASVRVLTGAAVLISLVLMGETELGRHFFYSDYSNTIIVAHRAGAVFGPENTVGALEQAIEDGADMAEIDVQQLKDGTLVVLHDTNFIRTAGVDLNVWDAEYEQVKALDAGRTFSPEYIGEPVPTLEEMLEAAKGKIQLMIELKATGHEKSLVKDTLALIEKHAMEEQCSIASLNLELLKQVKKQNPKIETVYITVLLISQSYDLEQVDDYSVETSFLSRELVFQAHAQGKKVFGWTASNDQNIKKVLRTEADGIVTDNPLLVQYHMDQIEDNFIAQGIEDIFF